MARWLDAALGMLCTLRPELAAELASVAEAVPREWRTDSSQVPQSTSSDPIN